MRPEVGEPADEFASPISPLDALLGTGLWLGVYSLLASAVPFIGDNDAALFSAYTRRALDGQIPYADFETYFSPGALALLGLTYAAFGFSALTAVSFQAGVQATLATLVFFVARGLGARPGIALAAATAQLGVGFAIWPQLSPHSVGSVGFVLVMCGLLLDWRAARPVENFIAGCFLGFYAWLQHHKALLALPVLLAYLVADWRLFPARAGHDASVGRRAAWLTAGFTATLVALFGPVFWRAGTAVAFDGLLIGPLIRYPRFSLAQIDLHRWQLEITGIFAGLPRSLGRPEGLGMLAALAWVLQLAVMGVLVARRSTDRRLRRRALVVAATLLAAAAGNGYRSSFVLQGFALPAVVVAGAFLGELCLAAVERRSRATPLTAVGPLFGTIFVLLGWAVVRDRALAYPYLAQTAFGPVAVARADEARKLERLLARIQATGMRHIYCHTYCPQLSLFTGLPNPTPYELLLPGMSEPEEFAAIQRFMEQARDPFIGIGLVALLNRAGDPVFPWIAQNYTFRDNTPTFSLWMRKDLVPDMSARGARNAPQTPATPVPAASR